ncbi:MAG TPA: VTT domain-containing protein [Fibrobacteria bacterium]|nr:VTT domain-containing protein [Fibrobacteria bacterium]
MQLWLDRLLAELAGLPWILQFLTISTAVGFTEELAVVGVIALARAGHVEWWIALPAITIGTLVGNILVWWVGFAVGEKALQWRLFAGIGQDRMARIRRQVQEKGGVAVFSARLVPGTRVGVFLLAGILGMNGWVFCFFLAAGTFVWILSLLGLVQALGGLAQHHPWVAALVLIAVLGGGFWALKRRARSLDPST